MSDATQTQDPSIEQTLNKTDLGHVIYENRKIFFALIIAVLVGATGYVLWKQVQKSNSLENSVKVFEFQSGIWTDVKSGKTGVPELMKSFDALDSSIQTAPVMIPVALEMSKFLFDKGNLAEADLVLSKVGTSHKHAVSSFFISMQRAVVLEKLGKIDEAIAMVEPLAQGKEVLMPAKISVELGRLYLVKGEKGKAQTQFDYVLNTFPNDEQAKLAKLYLSQIAK
jgi:predicted negative regulator of RcsB-dependent stress response